MTDQHIVNNPVQSSFRVLHVSDTHLSHEGGQPLDAWRSFVKYTERCRPDLLVHTGDLVADDPDCLADHEAAAAQWRRLTIPSRAIPGNHDVGDSYPDPYHGPITMERLQRYRENFGADHWWLKLGSWLLIGLNSQLFENDLHDEDEKQWAWFDDVLEKAPDSKIAVFLHKPPALESLADTSIANKTIGANARARFLQLAESGRLKLIGCGHLHEYMTYVSHGVLVVAAPSLSKGIGPNPIRGLGLRCNGAVEYQFREDGVTFQLLYQDELEARPVTKPDRSSP